MCANIYFITITCSTFPTLNRSLDSNNIHNLDEDVFSTLTNLNYLYVKQYFLNGLQVIKSNHTSTFNYISTGFLSSMKSS